MSAFEQKTVVLSYKLKIKNKFKSVVEETENVVTLLQSCVSAFNIRMKNLLDNNDENFSLLYEKLCKDFEKYQDKLFLLLASFEKPAEDDRLEESNETTVTEEKYSAPVNSNLQQVSHSPLGQSNSSQTFCKTLVQSQTSSISSASFCSFQDVYSVSQSELYEKRNFVEAPPRACAENRDVENNLSSSAQYSGDMTNVESALLQHSYDLNPEYHNSASQSSCYRSLSSNISASKASSVSLNLSSSHLGTFESEKSKHSEQHEENYQCLQSQIRPNSLILPTFISVPSVISATLTHITNPGDFWMQVENTKGYVLSFPMSEFKETSPLSLLNQGDFCLAPFKSVPYYYRAKVLTETLSDEKVKVFFIDHGSTQNIYVHKLRLLPKASYHVPMQAIHCCLCDISSLDGTWKPASIEKLKEFQNNSIKTNVKSLTCGKYAVQLIVTMSQFSEDFSCDIGETLCLDGLATMNGISDNLQDSVIQEISNQISCDSGVSVTSNQRASPPCNQRLCISSDVLVDHSSSSIYPELLNVSQKKIFSQFEQEPNLILNSITKNDMGDLISFESVEEVYDVICTATDKIEDKSMTLDRCLRTADCDCALHLVVPPPSMSFVEKDMMLVMLSNIVTPSEFYVNTAMENSLDELQEQMTATYESGSQNHRLINIDDLKEGMFCAARYDQDQNWYRVQVLRIGSEPGRMSDIYVQYVDYGNKAYINCSDLRPLTAQFAEHPSVSIKCSLYGIVPKANGKSTLDDIENESNSWSEYAVERFKQLTSFDRCLTAQISEEVSEIVSLQPSLESEPLQVKLWDTEGTKDVLINAALVENGVAEVDFELITYSQEPDIEQNKDPEILNQWDPMQAEYFGVENSYGVDPDDVGVAISGYKQQDESYVCKYFSLRGYCPRKNCQYEHVPLAESGVTRDQEEAYSLDPMPSLPDASSHVLVQVSAVISPGQFYSILPFGSMSVDEIDSLVNRGSSLGSSMEGEVGALFYAINKHYSKAPFSENTTVALSYGSIVAAWRSVDCAWHRGRIIDVADVTEPAKVFFVDFGDEDWVSRRMIRQILPEYLHTPFQAVECHMSDVEPLGFEKGKKWSTEALYRFKELVSYEVLLAHITYRCGKVLHLTLKKTTRKDHHSISESLVKERLAQYRTVCTSKKKESIYVPG